MADDASNPYIRTYAKDVAALSGKAPDATAPAASPAIPPAPVAEVSPAEKDRADVLARLRERAQKDPVHEGEFLPPSMPTPSPIPAPIPESTVPVVPPPVVSAPPAPQPVPRVSEPVGHASVIPQTPILPTPVPETPPATPAPLSNLPPPPPQPVAPPTFVPSPEARKPVSLDNVAPIHTYTSDFSDRIDKKGASAFSVLAAESDAGKLATPATRTKRKGGRGALIVAFGLVLILLAGGGAYTAYWYVSSHTFVPLAPTVPSLVFADDRQIVSGEGSTLMRAIEDSANTSLGDGQVRVLYMTEASTTSDKKTVDVPLPGGRIIGALQLSAPDILLRNIAPESTVGIVSSGGETRAFFILRVLSYERTFAGMLNWEGRMAGELSLLYPEYPVAALPPPTIATTTTFIHGKKMVATTTVEAPTPIILPPRFVDEVASNHDVRAYKDGTGRTIFLYGYRDKDTLIIARDESAFAELSNRLSATKQQ